MSIVQVVISVLLALIFVAILIWIIIYTQNKKNQQTPINVELLQQNIDHSKEVLKDQVETLARQLEDFKKSWSGSDIDKGEKLIGLISNIDGFQKSLNKKEDDYKRNADVIREQVTAVIKDLGKLQESSTVLGKINDNVQSLQDVFINNKKRGNLGEYGLEKILTNILGSNQKIWERQYKTNDGKIVDAYVKTRDDNEGIAIDSKFPYDNYQKYLTNEDSKIKENYLKDFRNDIRKRIDEVAKYISVKNKISSAVMFIASEEIFAFIYAHFSDDVVDYAFKKKVWITSPTTLSAILFAVEKNRKDIEFNKNLDQMAKKLIMFKTDFDRWVDRWENVKKDFNKANNDIKNLDTTHNKIAEHYQNIFEMSEELKESE